MLYNPRSTDLESNCLILSSISRGEVSSFIVPDLMKAGTGAKKIKRGSEQVTNVNASLWGEIGRLEKFIRCCRIYNYLH